MTTPLSLIASLRAKPGKEEELGRRLSALVAPTRAEAGCINYDLHRSQDDPALWMLYENWRSKADLDTHFATPHLQDFLARKEEVLEGDLDVRFFSMTTEQVAPKR